MDLASGADRYLNITFGPQVVEPSLHLLFSFTSKWFCYNICK